MHLDGSHQLLGRAESVIPGGVSSYARKFDRPLNFDRGKGAHVYDVDGNEYVDYLAAWGAISLGHSHPDVNEAVCRTLEEQDLYGMGTTELEVEVAEAIIQRIPSAEQVLFGVTGSEVVARAITLARAATGRRKVVKFQGCYHGWYDAVAMNHLSDPEDLGERDPFSAGLLPEATAETVVLPFNDLAALEAAVAEHEDEIAAVLLEPIAHNMGCVLPKEGYLEGLRRICDEHDILLIFDEIITGFRHSMGGVQEIEGVTPDLTTLGKGIANGYPMSVLCGKAEYMERFHTAGGDVAFGGTYNSHAGALAAAKATLEILEREDVHATLGDRCAEVAASLTDLIEDIGIHAHVKRYGTVFLIYFADPPMDDYEDVLRNDVETYSQYRWEMIDQGILMVPANARRNYLTASHSDEDIRRTIEAADGALREVSD